MTISELLIQKSRRNMLIGFVAWLAFAILVFLAPLSGQPFLHLIFFIPFIGAALAQVFFIRCPRCNGNVGLLMAQTLAPGSLKTRVTNCPFCGVDFNDGSKLCADAKNC
jgi:hypothetical protein